MKSKKTIIKSYLVFIIGLFINSVGVSIITRSNLGTSPISSIPYVLSLGFNPTLGQFTIFFSLLLIALQMIILGRQFKPVSLLQIPVSIAFGYFIDLSMYLLRWCTPDNYILRFAALLMGCIVLGFGVYIEVIADVVMLPGEAFVKSITTRFNTEFGITKIFFDASMTILAIVGSFILFKKLNGVGAGTVIAALVVGFFARLFGKKLKGFTEFLFGNQMSEVESE